VLTRETCNPNSMKKDFTVDHLKCSVLIKYIGDCRFLKNLQYGKLVDAAREKIFVATSKSTDKSGYSSDGNGANYVLIWEREEMLKYYATTDQRETYSNKLAKL
jgi:hypothetical protein